jgi:acetylornithine deacetylase
MTHSDIHDSINRWVDEHAEEVIQLAEALIRFPSENRAPKGLEKECQSFVAETMRGLGLELDIFEPPEAPGLLDHPIYWPGREYHDRPNVVGTRRGRNPAAGRSLLISSHADVVAGGKGGRFSPFEPVREGGRLYGRGANDMKGGLTASLAAARCLKELGTALNGDLIVESVVDEEIGGSNGTLAARLRGHNADACIVPEPNGMIVSPAHRGGCVWQISLKGSPGMPFGSENLINPAYGIGHLAVAIEEWEKERNASVTPPPLYAAAPGLPVVLSRVIADDFESGAGDGVPGEARLEVWTEEYPGTTFEDHYDRFIGHLKQIAAQTPVIQKCEMQVKQVTRFLPGSEIAADHPIVESVSREFARVVGHAPEVRGAPFACDAYVFNLFSPTPCIILGPRGGNAHAPDEWVETQDLLDLTKIFALTAVEWCGNAVSGE